MQYIIRFISFLFIFFLMGLFQLKAQFSVHSNLMYTEEGISDQTTNRIVGAVTRTMYDYKQYASLKDEITQEVSQKSIKDFKNLFAQNAKIIDDLSRFMLNDRNYVDYNSKIQDFLGKEGVDFKMHETQIKELAYDSAGYYQVEVHTEKTLYNGVETTGEIFKCKTGRTYFLKFFLNIEKDDLDDAKIFRITGEIVQRCGDSKPNFGVHSRIVSPFFNLSNFSPLDKGTKNKSLHLNEKLDYSANIGATFNIPITKKELLFLSINMSFSYSSFTNSLDGVYNFNHIIPDATITNSEGVQTFAMYVKEVHISSGMENLKILGVEVPLGLLYKKSLISNNRIVFGAYALVVPTFLIPTNKYTIESVEYKGLGFIYHNDHNTPEDEGNNIYFDVSNEQQDLLAAYGLGFLRKDEDVLLQGTVIKSQFTLFGRISPFIQYNFKENIALEFAIDYTHNLQSFLKAKDTQDGLFLPDLNNNLEVDNELDASTFETLYEDIKFNSIGFRLGLVWKMEN